METELEPPCAVPQAHCQEMQHSAPSEVFPPPLRIPEKIPPVKPCFKKKQQMQKRLDTEALRALHPIFTSLLGAGTLDAIFVPRGQNSDHGNLCEPVAKKNLGIASPCPPPNNSVPVLMPGAPGAQGQISEGPPEQGAQPGEQSFPSATSPANEPFQDRSLHAASGDAAAFPLCPGKILEGYPPGVLPDNNSCLVRCNGNPSDKFGAGLFQNKSEEASLDLVFELLNQLQYHTHQKDRVDICVDFLQGMCIFGSDCPKHHTVLPYHWQVRRTATQIWQSVTTDSQEHLERLYCNPDNDKVKIRYRCPVKMALPYCLIIAPVRAPGLAVLNQCLAKVIGWMRANKLKLNPDKMEVLLVGGSGFGVGDLDLVLNGVALPLRDKVHSLGVLLDPELSLEAQVMVVARSAFLQLWLIHQLHPYLENDCLATVTHALVTSRLYFCNALCVGLPLKKVRILQLVVKYSCQVAEGTGRCSHITPVLRQLHWLPIEVQAQVMVLVITYKALNGLGPGYLKECLCPYMPSCPLRSAAEALLREPSMNDIRRILYNFRQVERHIEAEGGVSDRRIVNSLLFTPVTMQIRFGKQLSPGFRSRIISKQLHYGIFLILFLLKLKYLF
ncbi:Protein mono-ADP-ribosyltransferase TIPARP [Varanus komodoensis]|nr:Protein mono-ADP-ribosyltransferase TIPARP [Varanus komodoensis]